MFSTKGDTSFKSLVPRNPYDSCTDLDREETLDEDEYHSRMENVFEVTEIHGCGDDASTEETENVDSDDDSSVPRTNTNETEHSQRSTGRKEGNHDVKATTNAQKPVKAGRTRKKPNFKWEKTPFEFSVTIPAENSSLHSEEGASSPIDYFKRFFTDELIQMIVDESNRYGNQKKGAPAELTVNDIRRFISIEITMDCISTRDWKSYWSPPTRIPRIADIMTLSKYDAIRSCLHFVDNGTVGQTDKYFKIRPIAEYLRQKFMGIRGVDRKFSIDEMWIAYTTRRPDEWQRLMSMGPTEWGFQMFARTGMSGIVYDFFLNAGEQTFDHVSFNDWQIEESFPSKCVLALCQSIEDPAMSVVFLDGLFSSLSLINLLRHEYGILSIGVLGADEFNEADLNLASDEDLLKRGQTAFDRVSDNRNRVTVVKWAHTEVVTLASSYVGVEPMGKLRIGSKRKKCDPIECPSIVEEYHAFTEVPDTLATIYDRYMPPDALESFKWYMAIFKHLLNLTLVNAWRLYLHENSKNKMSFFDFRLSVSKALLGHPQQPKKKAQPSPEPCKKLRLDQRDHFPVFEKRGKCRFCHENVSKIECSKCRIRLCVQPNRNCFLKYHTLEDLPKETHTRRENSTTDSDIEGAESEEDDEDSDIEGAESEDDDEDSDIEGAESEEDDEME